MWYTFRDFAQKRIFDNNPNIFTTWIADINNFLQK